MTANEFITLFRRNAEDASYTYDINMPSAVSLWSNFQLLQYLDRAQNEFAEKTYCFKDDSTFSLTILADDTDIDLDERIIKIERAETLSNNRILDLKSIEEFQTSYGLGTSWETRTGTPSQLLTDTVMNSVRLYPIPTEGDTIKLTVRRYPLEPIAALDDELEVPTRYQYGLLYRMQYEAYTLPKALVSGYGEAAVVSKSNWDNFITDSYKHFRVKTQGPGKTRYSGI